MGGRDRGRGGVKLGWGSLGSRGEAGAGVELFFGGGQVSKGGGPSGLMAGKDKVRVGIEFFAIAPSYLHAHTHTCTHKLLMHRRKTHTHTHTEKGTGKYVFLQSIGDHN